MSSSSPTATTLSAVTNLQDFLDSVPYSLTAVLVRLGPFFSAARNAAEVFTWSSSSYDSWLALAAWWAVCLLAGNVLRYLLPIAVFFSLCVTASTSSTTRVTPTPVSESSLQTAITDLTTLQSLLPAQNVFSVSLPVFPTLLRVCVVLYVPYLALTHFVPLRIILGLLGTVILSWHSPWASVLRKTLTRSAWTRWAVYHTWSKISGQPLSPRSVSPQSTAAAGEPGNSLRFLFTIYENQRWWMGLDFTAALLPSERPSWCSVSQQPVSPPNAFTLPDPTTTYLRDRNGKRMKRTATWRWEEPEWKVLVTKEDGAVSRVEKPLPSMKEENASFLMKAAGKMKEVNSPTSPGSGEGDHVADETEGEAEDEDLPTDPDGWVYGDNKWEGKSNKGGMGKYTRYRRWTRVAVVSETVEPVEDGEVGIERARGRSNIATVSSVTGSPPRRSQDSSDGSPLRQRLKSALAKASH